MIEYYKLYFKTEYTLIYKIPKFQTLVGLNFDYICCLSSFKI